MSIKSDAQLEIDIDNIFTTNNNNEITGALVNAFSKDSNDSKLNVGLADVNNGYLAIDNTGKVDVSFIKKNSPTGQFLKDDGTWATVNNANPTSGVIPINSGGTFVDSYLSQDANGVLVASGKNIYFASNYGIDTVATVGSDVLNIGATNANVINYGNSSTTHNFLGTAIYELQVNSYVVDKLITLNSGGAAASGIGVGFEIEENAVIKGYVKTNAARSGYSFLAPANTAYTDFIFSSSSARTKTFQDSSSTIAEYANKLSVFASTSSAELAGVISDETGYSSGALAVFNISPVFGVDITTPLIKGSSSSGGNLTIYSTSHGTKGVIQIGSTDLVNIGNKTSTSQRLLRIGQDTAWIDLGSYQGGTSFWALYGNQTTPGAANYALFGNNTDTYLRAPGGTLYLNSAAGAQASASLSSTGLFVSSGGNLTGNTGFLQVRAITEQARYEYDASNYYSIVVGSVGLVTFTAGGSGAKFRFANQVYNHGAGVDVFSTAFGLGALTSNSGGAYNTAFGVDALKLNVSSSSNVAIGTSALKNSVSGNGSVAIGTQASALATSATDNVVIGYNAGYNNLVGSYNVFVGYEAGLGALSNANTGIGYRALKENTGYHNTALGYVSLEHNITGNQNTVFGFGAGNSNVGGSLNVMLGYAAGYYETGSNKLFIDNATRLNEADGRLKSLLYGVFDADPVNQRLTINGAFRLHNYTAADASTIVTVDGDVVYVTTTDATFTSIGFWGRENSIWIKL